MDYVKDRAIKFANWLIITRMWQTDLTTDELYELFIEKMMVDEMEEEDWNKRELMCQWDA